MKSIEKKAKMDKKVMETFKTYEKVKNHLESNNLVITLALSKEEKNILHDLYLLTNKPFVYAVNISEDQLNMGENELRKLI